MTRQLMPPQLLAADRPHGAGDAAAAGRPADGVGPAAAQPQAPPPKRQRRLRQALQAAEAAVAEADTEAEAAHGTEEAATALGLHPDADLEQLPNQCPLPLRYLRGRATNWQPRDARPALNLRLDGRIVQSAAGGARISYSHVVVLDDFIDEATRAALLAFLTAPADSSKAGSMADSLGAADGMEAAAEAGRRAAAGGAAAADEEPPLPEAKWERRTADQAGLAATWGVKVH